jgi:hypothetical protein
MAFCLLSAKIAKSDTINQCHSLRRPVGIDFDLEKCATIMELEANQEQVTT